MNNTILYNIYFDYTEEPYLNFSQDINLDNTLIFSLTKSTTEKNCIIQYTVLSILFLSKIISNRLINSYMEEGKKFIESQLNLALFKIVDIYNSFNEVNTSNVMTESIYNINEESSTTMGDSQILRTNISEENLNNLYNNENKDFVEHKNKMNCSLVSIDLNDSIQKVQIEKIHDTLHLGWINIKV